MTGLTILVTVLVDQIIIGFVPPLKRILASGEPHQK
jgi:hypothetical protein